MMKASKKYLICIGVLWLALASSASASGLFDGLLPTQGATAAPSNAGTGLFDGWVSPSEKVLTHQEQKWLSVFESILGVSPSITLEEDEIWAIFTVPGSGSYTLMMYAQNDMHMLAFSPIGLSGLEAVLDAVSHTGTLVDFDYDQARQCLFLMVASEEKQEKPGEKPGLPQMTQAPAASGRQYSCSICHDMKDCPDCLGLKECNECFGDKGYSCTWCIGGECLACDDGQILVGFDAKDRPKYQKCSQCSGGKCRYCGGDGWMRCEICRGLGKCQTCGGNGKCPACR